ncbi:hypothetical protein CPT_Season12_064 [Salmonella phage Season12]|uniref:Uncharacterized protein n=1 Tax=Salmonella phage Season12 TaxID=2500556 RepID=A0A3T0IJC2_9CAUD|nr:hypothetical protein CPT_Season12_064 [Salmonella phage Season12]
MVRESLCSENNSSTRDVCQFISSGNYDDRVKLQFSFCRRGFRSKTRCRGAERGQADFFE